MDINKDSHISFISNDDVKRICNSFFKRRNVDINHLNYIHKNNDGTVYYVCSNHGWLKHYFSRGYVQIGAFETRPELSKDRYVLWDSLGSDDPILKDSRELINVEHGITIVQKTNEGCGFFNFGNNNGGILTLNTYVNNLNVLNEFIPHFYKEASHIIHDAMDQSILISPSNIEHDFFAKDQANCKKSMRLAKRETDCISWYLKGKNSGEIAIILGISRRTVETYIENVKTKLGCTNLFQIGYCLAEMKYMAHGFIPKL